MVEMDNGQHVKVFRRDTDEQGEYWAHWFDGVYLTKENIGNGPEARIKNRSTGEHHHLKPKADDIRITVENE
jgi:hypothetical protein